jgi:DNA-binding MarR family transcriptional regulator
MPSRPPKPYAAPPERRLSLLLLLVAANQRMLQLVERELAADGVDADGYGALSLIGVRGELRLTELADELGMPLTTASDVVRRLEARGHVRRRPNPDDGRSFLFELSARGDREWRRGFGALQRIDARLAREIDQGEMRAALTALGDAFGRALTDI